MRASDLRVISLFDGLADGQLADLAAGGTEIAIEPGADLSARVSPQITGGC